MNSLRLTYVDDPFANGPDGEEKLSQEEPILAVKCGGEEPFFLYSAVESSMDESSLSECMRMVFPSPGQSFSPSVVLMEVAADLRPILGPPLVRLDPMRVKQLQSPLVYQAIDDLAKLSAQCMQLRASLTCCEKLINSDNTLYLSWEYNESTKTSKLVGFAKVGRKKLFLYDAAMQTYEGEILCLLDFYVHYSEQRKGHGKAILDYMLQNEHAEPYQLALDNPTVTLLGFMNRCYNLNKPVWQNTNFVVFDELFKSVSAANGTCDNGIPPEGWSRPQTPRRIGNGMTETRWLTHAISGHASKGNAMASPVDADQTPEGALANRANQARCRKAHILSSQPLW